MDDLPELPVGWTEERVLVTPAAELHALPADDFTRIDAFLTRLAEKRHAELQAAAAARRTSIDQSRANSGLPSLSAQDDDLARRMGLNLALIGSTQSELMDMARYLDKQGHDNWGYVVIKGCGYEDHAKWNEFWAQWQALSDARLRDLGATGNLRQGFASRLKWQLLENSETLSNADPATARRVFEEFCETGQTEHGLEVNVCLLVDQKALDRGASSQEFTVLVVDRDEPDPDATGADDYKGHFMADFAALVPELYLTLDILTATELWPGNGAVWSGIA